MRHHTEPEQVTRLLIQKPKAFAELDEMSRMAISVLTDEGWSFSRVGMDMRVAVTAERVIQEVDPAQLANAKLVAHLADAELRFAALRIRVVEAGAQQWLMAMLAFFVAAVMYYLGAGRMIVALLPVCLVCYIIARPNRKKGAA